MSNGMNIPMKDKLDKFKKMISQTVNAPQRQHRRPAILLVLRELQSKGLLSRLCFYQFSQGMSTPVKAQILTYNGNTGILFSYKRGLPCSFSSVYALTKPFPSGLLRNTSAILSQAATSSGIIETLENGQRL